MGSPLSCVLIRDRGGGTCHHSNRDETCTGPLPEMVSARTQPRLDETFHQAYGSLALNYGVSKQMNFLTKERKN